MFGYFHLSVINLYVSWKMYWALYMLHVHVHTLQSCNWEFPNGNKQSNAEHHISYLYGCLKASWRLYDRLSYYTSTMRDITDIK